MNPGDRPAFLVFVRDRNGKPLKGATIEFTRNGKSKYGVPNSEGRGSIEGLKRADVLEISATYEGETQSARPAATVDFWEFVFDVDLDPAVPPPAWFPVVGAAFALLTFVSLFYLLVGADVPSDRKMIFNVWMAFCVAASGAFLGGSALAKGTLKIPFMDVAPIQFAAYGGFSIFLVTLIVMVTVNR